NCSIRQKRTSVSARDSGSGAGGAGSSRITDEERRDARNGYGVCAVGTGAAEAVKAVVWRGDEDATSKRWTIRTGRPAGARASTATCTCTAASWAARRSTCSRSRRGPIKVPEGPGERFL